MRDQLINKIKESFPNLKIKFKDKSLFMKILSKILFFTNFKNYTTTIGSTIYFPNEKEFNDPGSFEILAHEYMHLEDSKNLPLYPMFYLFPQCLAVLSLLSLYAIGGSNLWLLSLLSLLFLLPFPAPYRTYIEIKGYAMDLIIHRAYNKLTPELLNSTAEKFTKSNYYYMWPKKDNVLFWLKTFVYWPVGCDSEFICAFSPACLDVLDIIYDNQFAKYLSNFLPKDN